MLITAINVHTFASNNWKLASFATKKNIGMVSQDIAFNETIAHNALKTRCVSTNASELAEHFIQPYFCIFMWKLLSLSLMQLHFDFNILNNFPGVTKLSEKNGIVFSAETMHFFGQTLVGTSSNHFSIINLFFFVPFSFFSFV